MIRELFKKIFFRIPDQISSEFELEIGRINLVRARVTSLLLILFSLVMSAAFTVVRFPVLSVFPNYTYLELYFLLFAVMILFYLLFNRYNKNIIENISKISITGYLFTFFVLLWCALTTIVDHFVEGETIVYATAVIAIAVFPFYGPVKLAGILVPVHVIYLVLLIVFRDSIGNDVSKMFGTTATVFLSYFISRVLYHSKYMEFANKLTIEKQNRDLNALNSELVEANRKLAHLSETDSLTGLLNRRMLEQLLRKEWNRCRRHEFPFSILMVDIDNFKKVNDRYGHPAGDDCLVHVAKRLAQAIKRASDNIARYGGEEFLISLPHLGPDEAYEFAERIRLDVERNEFRLDDREEGIPVTVSVGVCTVVPSAEYRLEDLIYTADKALYKAKEWRNMTVCLDIMKA